MDLKEAGGEDVDWTLLAQDSFPWGDPENMIMHLHVPFKVKNFFINLKGH